jgi:hypothetical protein
MREVLRDYHFCRQQKIRGRCSEFLTVLWLMFEEEGPG